MGDLGFGDLLKSGRRLYRARTCRWTRSPRGARASSRPSRSSRAAMVELDVDGEAPGPVAGALRDRARRRCGWWCRGSADAACCARSTATASRRCSPRCSTALPAADPFAPTTIVVGSHLVSRWLTARSRSRAGIAAGLELVTFDRVLERRGRDEAGASGSTARSRAARGRARVGARRRCASSRGCRRCAAYLAAAPAPGDRAGPRRVQLAEHLAKLVLELRD